MTKNQKQSIVEVTLPLLLFFYLLWHLIYLEKSTSSIVLTASLLVLSAVVFLWRGWGRGLVFSLSLRDFLIAFKYYAIPILVFLAACVSIVFLKDKPARMPHLEEFGSFILWGVAQQLLVQGFFYLRFVDIARSRNLAILLTAIVFTALHLPNRDLMIITFVGCLYLSWLFDRYRNVLLVGVMHGLISLIIIVTLKEVHAISDSYRVGPQPAAVIRNIINENADQAKRVGAYIPSSPPKHLDKNTVLPFFPIENFKDLSRALNSDEFTFVVISAKDLKAYRKLSPEVGVYIWGETLMWRRHTSKHLLELLSSIREVSERGLNSELREWMLLISNRRQVTA